MKTLQQANKDAARKSKKLEKIKPLSGLGSLMTKKSII
jgi:hypothetical protein